jgi:hypothetical protein
MKTYSETKTDCHALNASETQLWEEVQKAYALSRAYRAGDDPEYAKALAEYQRVAFGPPRTNVIPFPSRGRR